AVAIWATFTIPSRRKGRSPNPERSRDLQDQEPRFSHALPYSLRGTLGPGPRAWRVFRNRQRASGPRTGSEDLWNVRENEKIVFTSDNIGRPKFGEILHRGNRLLPISSARVKEERSAHIPRVFACARSTARIHYCTQVENMTLTLAGSLAIGSEHLG